MALISRGDTEAIAVMLAHENAFAPALLHLELANVLRTACKRGRVVAQDTRSLVDQIEALSIEIDQETPRAGAILSLA